MVAVRAGGDRQVVHEVIREHSLGAWSALQNGQSNPLVNQLCNDSRITKLVPTKYVRELLQADSYIGDAPERARLMAVSVREALAQTGGTSPENVT
jgi:adenylosuccinate lyase